MARRQKLLIMGDVVTSKAELSVMVGGLAVN